MHSQVIGLSSVATGRFVLNQLFLAGTKSPESRTTVKQLHFSKLKGLRFCRCFGMLLCPGRNIKNSDMHLIDMVSLSLYTLRYALASFRSNGRLPADQ